MACFDADLQLDGSEMARSTSTLVTSDASTQNGLNHHPSVTSSSVTYVTYDGPSSLATTVNRGNSTGSYGSYTGSDWGLTEPSRYLRQMDQYATGSVGDGSNITRKPGEIHRSIVEMKGKGPLGLHDEYDDAFWEDEDEDDGRFVNFSLLSHIAVQLRDKVPRGTHVKGSIPWPRAFTGKDIVVRCIFLISTSFL
jgi:RHO1 GDP-GTP exchange protein 1/2